MRYVRQHADFLLKRADTAEVTPHITKHTGLGAACALALVVFTAAAAAQVPLYEKVVFGANVLFETHQPTLAAAGLDTLDRFVADIQGLDSQRIMALGYAGHLGSESASQALAEQRVDAVRAYLVSKGIAASRVQTGAWRETQADTLQPDHHVFIEVSGTRIAK